VVVGWWQL